MVLDAPRAWTLEDPYHLYWTLRVTSDYLQELTHLCQLLRPVPRRPAALVHGQCPRGAQLQRGPVSYDPVKYGESLLYTPLGIADSSELSRMVRYLVDNAGVPVGKLGGRLGYPIIRAAYLTRYDPDVGARGRVSDSRTEWSALKLANFADRPESLKALLQPKARSRTSGDGEEEEWDEAFHMSKPGHKKNRRLL